MDTAHETTTARARLGTWLFLTCPALAVETMRLQGRIGADARADTMLTLAKAFDRGSVTLFTRTYNGFISGAAMRGPDGSIVAAYYGPGDLRNTRLDWEGYSLQHRLVEPEALIPLRRRSSNDLTDDAYLPLAARDTRRNQ